MSKIVLKITPVDYYFFGTENINATTSEANYYLKSTMLPQQSTVLGGIRYALLINAGEAVFENNKIINKQVAATLIGRKSFELSETVFDFGAINGISPVFLIKGDEKYIPCPIIDSNHLFEMKAGLPTIQKYNPKAGYFKKYTNGNNTIDEKEIFEELVLTQNKKDKITNEDAFFKTQYYTLKEDWAFGIELEIDDEKRLSNNFVMKMGGENRLFIFSKTVIKKTTAALNLYASPTYFVITLISDTYIKDYNPALFDFAIINTVPFRYLSSNVNETEKYTHRSKTDNKELKASKLIEMIEKGSVFYFKTEELLKAFETQIANDYLQKAGLNHYIILIPNKN